VDTLFICIEGKPKPFQSDFRKAWKTCPGSKICVSLYENKICRCARMSTRQAAFKENVIGEKWEIVNNYVPLSPDNSAWDIFNHLNSGAFPQCAICPEKLFFVKPEEKE
jgi:hypothetical protein